MWNAWQLLGAGLFMMIFLVHVTFVKHLWGFTLEGWRRIWASLLKRLINGCDIWQCCNSFSSVTRARVPAPQATSLYWTTFGFCLKMRSDSCPRRCFPVSHSQLQMRMWTLIRRIFDQLTFIRGPRACYSLRSFENSIWDSKREHEYGRQYQFAIERFVKNTYPEGNWTNGIFLIAYKMFFSLHIICTFLNESAFSRPHKGFFQQETTNYLTCKLVDHIKITFIDFEPKICDDYMDFQFSCHRILGQYLKADCLWTFIISFRVWLSFSLILLATDVLSNNV